MISANETKYVQVLAAGSTLATNNTTIHQVDSIQDGVKYHRITFIVSGDEATATNASNRWTELKVYESDDTNASNFTLIEGLEGAASGGDFVTAVHNSTSVGQISVLTVNAVGRKRYFGIEVVPNATNYTACTISAALSDGSESPASRGDNDVSA